jgi:hypothetical protein
MWRNLLPNRWCGLFATFTMQQHLQSLTLNGCGCRGEAPPEAAVEAFATMHALTHLVLAAYLCCLVHILPLVSRFPSLRTLAVQADLTEEDSVIPPVLHLLTQSPLLRCIIQDCSGLKDGPREEWLSRTRAQFASAAVADVQSRLHLV